MMRGNATSDDEVPSTSSSSSLMYLRNFQRLKPCNRAISPEHHEDEERAGQVHAQQQLAQRQQRLQAVLADGEGHGAERPEGRELS